MGYFADCYVIINSRSKKLVNHFLDHFLPEREERTREYQVPQYADHPDISFDNVSDLMAFLEVNPSSYQAIYWGNKSKEHPNQYGMTFYTKDGYLIFGISRDVAGDSSDTQAEDECLQELKHFFETDEGYITYEKHPPDNYDEFIRIMTEQEL
jgi:hypothetical protein